MQVFMCAYIYLFIHMYTHNHLSLVHKQPELIKTALEGIFFNILNIANVSSSTSCVQ